MPELDLRGQLFSEDCHLFAVRRPDVRGQVRSDALFTPDGSKPKQVGKPACHQPRKPAVIACPPECKAPIAVEAVPAQIGRFKSPAGHGFHWIPEDRFYLSDLDGHGSKVEAAEDFPPAGCRICR